MLANQQKFTSISYEQKLDAVWRTYLERLPIGTDGRNENVKRIHIALMMLKFKQTKILVRGVDSDGWVKSYWFLNPSSYLNQTFVYKIEREREKV